MSLNAVVCQQENWLVATDAPPRVNPPPARSSWIRALVEGELYRLCARVGAPPPADSSPGRHGSSPVLWSGGGWGWTGPSGGAARRFRARRRASGSAENWGERRWRRWCGVGRWGGTRSGGRGGEGEREKVSAPTSPIGTTGSGDEVGWGCAGGVEEKETCGGRNDS